MPDGRRPSSPRTSSFRRPPRAPDRVRHHYHLARPPPDREAPRPGGAPAPQVRRPSGPRSSLRSSGREPELARQPRGSLSPAGERESHRLDLGGRQRAFLEPPDRLTLEELAEEVHERQHQLRHRPLHVVGVGVPSREAGAARPPPELGPERPAAPSRGRPSRSSGDASRPCVGSERVGRPRAAHGDAQRRSWRAPRATRARYSAPPVPRDQVIDAGEERRGRVALDALVGDRAVEQRANRIQLGRAAAPWRCSPLGEVSRPRAEPRPLPARGRGPRPGPRGRRAEDAKGHLRVPAHVDQPPRQLDAPAARTGAPPSPRRARPSRSGWAGSHPPWRRSGGARRRGRRRAAVRPPGRRPSGPRPRGIPGRGCCQPLPAEPASQAAPGRIADQRVEVEDAHFRPFRGRSRSAAHRSADSRR